MKTPLLFFALFLSLAVCAQTTYKTGQVVQNYMVDRSGDSAWLLNATTIITKAQQKATDSSAKYLANLAARIFLDSMAKLTQGVSAREMLTPADSTGKVFQLTANPIDDLEVTGISETTNMKLIPGEDFKLVVSTNRITLLSAKGLLFSGKRIYVTYIKKAP